MKLPLPQGRVHTFLDTAAASERLQIAVAERRQMRLGNSAHLGRLHISIFKKHQKQKPPDAVLGWRRGVFVDVKKKQQKQTNKNQKKNNQKQNKQHAGAA